MDGIQHVTVQAKPCAFTFAQLLLNQGNSLVSFDTEAPNQRDTDFVVEELLQESILETAAKVSTADIEKRLFVPESTRYNVGKPKNQRKVMVLPRQAPCIELGHSTTLKHFLSRKFRPLTLHEAPPEQCQLESKIFVEDETPALFRLQLIAPQAASRYGLEQLRAWAGQNSCVEPVPIDSTSRDDPTITGSVPELFRQVEIAEVKNGIHSQLLQRYSDRNMKLGTPLKLEDQLEKMNKSSVFAQYAGLSLQSLKQRITADHQQASAADLSKVMVVHCICSLQKLVTAQADSALVESYLTEFLNKTNGLLQKSEKAKIESLLEIMGKTRHIVVNEDRLCDKDKILFNLVQTLADNRVGVVERDLGQITIVFDLHTAAIVSPELLSESWIEGVVDYLGRDAVGRFALIYIFVPLVPENLSLTRLLGMLTARLSAHVHVTVRMTTNLPDAILSVTKQSKWFGRLDWNMASRDLDTFELNTKAEDMETLQSECFLSQFPSINAVLARCIIALSGNLGAFLSQGGEAITELGGNVSPGQIDNILKVLNFDVNPARTKALRKRKLGLATAANGKNPRQLTLSWKS